MSVHAAAAVLVRYEPEWRVLPRLAWVGARAYVPAWLPGTALPALVATSSLLVWLPLVVTMRAGRRLAALEGRSMVEIAPVGRRTPSSTVTPILLATVLLVTLMGGITGLAFLLADLTLRAGLGTHAAMTAGVAVVVVPTALGVLPMLLDAPRVIGSRPRLARTIGALQAESPGAPIWRLGALAAWPHGHGHGSALLEGLLRDWEAGGYAVVSARNQAIEDWYVRLGVREHPADSAMCLDLRSAWQQT
jgi:hypothetical protein